MDRTDHHFLAIDDLSHAPTERLRPKGVLQSAAGPDDRSRGSHKTDVMEIVHAPKKSLTALDVGHLSPG
jgi:hypothetical protein